MTVLVVYESMYGSTQAIAEAIAEGLAPAGPVRVVEVGALAKSPGGRSISQDLELLVVGGPTHAFGLSRPNTRQDAARDAPRGEVVSAGMGLREWLTELKLPVGGTRFAAFDTKVLRPKLPGSAAKSADKQLRQMGGRSVADPRSFGVHGKSDGIVEGELENAKAWGAALAALVVRH
jgi:hypothetical protein